MTTLQMPTFATAESQDTRDAQEGRWIAWKQMVAADDLVARRRVRIAFVAVLIIFACVTLAVLL